MMNQKSLINRRHMLKKLGFGSMVCFFPGFASSRSDASPDETVDQIPGPAFQKVTDPAKVSVVKGNDCRDNIFAALMNIEDQIMASMEGKKSILLKPNIVSTTIPLSVTHVDAVRGILDFLKPRWKGPIIIGDSTGNSESTMVGFQNFNYMPLEKEYGVTLLDLNKQSYTYRYVFGGNNTPQPIRIIKTFLDKDMYSISAAKLKTHDRVLVTLALKNFLLGAPYNDYRKNDKRITHQTTQRSKNTILHYNMFRLAQEIYPDLGVIDGFEAMEGNGPKYGTPLDARIAMASLDSLALDTLATKIMGFDPSGILYLSSMNEAGMGQGDLNKITTIGTDLKNIQHHFKPHESLVEPYGLG